MVHGVDLLAETWCYVRMPLGRLSGTLSYVVTDIGHHTPPLERLARMRTTALLVRQMTGRSRQTQCLLLDYNQEENCSRRLGFLCWKDKTAGQSSCQSQADKQDVSGNSRHSPHAAGRCSGTWKLAHVQLHLPRVHVCSCGWHLAMHAANCRHPPRESTTAENNAARRSSHRHFRPQFVCQTRHQPYLMMPTLGQEHTHTSLGTVSAGQWSSQARADKRDVNEICHHTCP
jgi:hypothetical protein